MSEFDKKYFKDLGLTIAFVFAIIALMLAISINTFASGPGGTYEGQPIVENIDNKDERRIEVDNIIDSLRSDIIVELDSYMDAIAPHNNVDPEVMFDMCITYEIDPVFVLAQGQIESHYATKGTAARTKSIFNVGAYDGHSAARQQRNGFGFKTSTESIEPFLILLTSDYLVNGKTTDDLLRNYVNHLGMRYASNPRYEQMLRSVCNKISNSTSINSLMTEYNEWVEYREVMFG